MELTELSERLSSFYLFPASQLLVLTFLPAAVLTKTLAALNTSGESWCALKPGVRVCVPVCVRVSTSV